LRTSFRALSITQIEIKESDFESGGAVIVILARKTCPSSFPGELRFDNSQNVKMTHQKIGPWNYPGRLISGESGKTVKEIRRRGDKE
jgi:hypothetical protein